MSKRQWLCILGFWVAVFLFLGVPPFWDKIIAGITGVIIIIVAYNLPHEKKQSNSYTDSSFTENNNYQ